MGAASPTSRKAIVGIGLAIGTPFGFLQFILFLFDSQKIGTSWALLIGLLLFFLVPCSCMYIAQRTEQELTGYELSSIIALSCAAVKHTHSCWRYLDISLSFTARVGYG